MSASAVQHQYYFAGVLFFLLITQKTVFQAINHYVCKRRFEARREQKMRGGRGALEEVIAVIILYSSNSYRVFIKNCVFP